MSHPWLIFPSGKKVLNMANSFKTFWKDTHKHMHLVEGQRSLNSVRNWANKYRGNTISHMLPLNLRYRMGVRTRLYNFTINFMLAVIAKKKTHNLQSTLNTCITLQCQCNTFLPSFFIDILIPLERKPFTIQVYSKKWPLNLKFKVW